MHDATHPLGLLLSLGLGGLLGLEELLQSILRQRLAVGIKPDLGHLLRGRLGGGCSFGHAGAQILVGGMRHVARTRKMKLMASERASKHGHLCLWLITQ